MKYGFWKEGLSMGFDSQFDDINLLLLKRCVVNKAELSEIKILAIFKNFRYILQNYFVFEPRMCEVIHSSQKNFILYK